MTRVAAVDCGTNTIRLLVADLDPATGAQQDLVRELRIVRLGEGVDRTGRLSPGALERVFAAAEEYAALVRPLGVRALRFVATSAARDADNSDDFTTGILSRLGVGPEVVSGDEEARLTFEGATRTLPAAAAPVAVVDIGGGSTEVVLGEPAEDPQGRGRVTSGRSLDIGSVRVTERLMPSDPPTAAEVAAATALVDEALDTLPSYGVEVGGARTVVGVAGTVTTLATLMLGLDHWDRDRVHHASFPSRRVHDMVARVVAATVAERESLGVPRGRSDVIGAGALILDRVLRRSGADALTVSDADILDGIAWSTV